MNPPPCPRCGHDTAGDPSRTLAGNHLVIQAGQIRLEATPHLEANSVTFVAKMDTRLVWCFDRPELVSQDRP